MKNEKFEESIICECGYYNKLDYVSRYGTCLRCGKVLNSKAKFDYEMVCKLRLWRGRKHGESAIRKKGELI